MNYIFDVSGRFVIEANSEEEARKYWEDFLDKLRAFNIYNQEFDILNIKEIDDDEYDLRCIMGEL